jgi:hypothetical protein
VDAGEVAAVGDVPGELVELAAHGQVLPGPGEKGGAVGVGDHRVGHPVGLVEGGLEDGRAGAGDDGVTGGVRGVQRAALGVGLGEEGAPPPLAGRGEAGGGEEVGVEGVVGGAGQVGLDPASELLRAQAAVDPPLLIQQALRDTWVTAARR